MNWTRKDWQERSERLASEVEDLRKILALIRARLPDVLNDSSVELAIKLMIDRTLAT